MRAAFKNVIDNKQVAVLAPTTVLTFQHSKRSRKDSPLSRRASNAQPLPQAPPSRKRFSPIWKRARWTCHRHASLLSKDVKFADLGLLIVDERAALRRRPQRAPQGNAQKRGRPRAPATPIRARAHVARGLRDMSVIETPPRDRLAIQTVVAPFQEELVQTAIRNRTARDGQGSFFHNRVVPSIPLGRQFVQNHAAQNRGFATAMAEKDLPSRAQFGFDGSLAPALPGTGRLRFECQTVRAEAFR